jgi:hypothetical protein
MSAERQLKEWFHPETIDTSKLAACQCIVIDGDDGSGKTPLARKIAGALGAKLISLDQYLSEDGRPYCDQIKHDSLKNDIMLGGQKVVIEGVCALKVLAKIGVGYDHHIFTKRVMFGKPAYDEYLDERIPLPKSKTARDIVLYYRELKPFDRCDETQTRYIDFEVGE